MPGTPPYVELHCHSAYSFLDGVSLPQELIGRAAELGHTALALTDHNSVSGSMELAQAAHGHDGIRAIHGAEIDLTEGRHLTLLVREARGWRNLCRLITHAHAHTRDSSRERAEPAVALATVLEHAEGLVCLTGCAGRGVHDESTARGLLEVFGPQGLRVELQRPYARHDRARNRALEALARRLGVACVATGDVHAHARSRAELQDAFVALRHHTTLDASEPLRRGNCSHVLSTPRAMAQRFADHPRAVAETLHLSEQLCFDLGKDLGYRYPGAEDANALRGLVELCQARLEDRYGAQVSAEHRRQARERLEEELRVIDRLGLAGFFLLHHEMLELAREVAMEIRGGAGGSDSPRSLLAPGRGRGSSVSSIVCYLTGLSHIDPIANRLLLGRFLHEGLQGLPDIDLDFPREIREILIPRVHERFGRERAALVAAFPTYRARGAIRELGKVLGLPSGEIERIARAAEHYMGAPEHGIATALPTRSERWRWLARLVEEAYGLPRHLSQHPGGMVVATRPLIDCCPVVPAAMEGRQMVQWDKDSCADAGFLKIDLLGLGMLSAVERCVESIAHTRSERIDLSRIPFDDPETFKAIREADTVGVFQIESRAQMQSLKRTQPHDLDDLTVQVAIVRPGPIQGGAINPYIERRQRLREDPAYEVPYPHPSLREVLACTLGTVIFQDQVMEVAQVFAGFTPGEADGLRRAMSRKRSHAALQSHCENFLAGARRHVRADPRTAEQVWEMVSGFAGFGFPKAHGAAFGLLAYQSTWLRVHYGPEFLCALLNEQPMGFYAPDSLVHEAEGRGIAVLGLDVNASEVECTVEEKSVRLGLGYIKGIAAAKVAELVAERKCHGPFRSLGQLAARIGAGRSTLEQLAWSGACDSLVRVASAPLRMGGSDARRRLALWQLGIPTRPAPTGRDSDGETQLVLPLELPEAPRLRPLSRWQRLLADYATSGVTVGDHVMAALRPRLQAPMLATSAQLPRLPQGCSVTVAGLVIARQRPGTAKGIMFLLFEDEWGTINLIVPRAVYEVYRPLARAEPLLLARGRLECSPEGVLNVIVRELVALERFLDAEEPRSGARVHRLPVTQPAVASGAEEQDGDGEDGAEVGAGMRAVAPPMQSLDRGGGGRDRPGKGSHCPSRGICLPKATTASAPFSAGCLRYPEPIARLGDTELDVFPLCLGGNVFGWTIDEERSFAVLDAYTQAGGNFIDTADTYGRHGSGGAGESERIIGRWMAARGNREQLVIATKVGMSSEMHGLSADIIRRGVADSRQRLGVDRIDLYYAHQDDPKTPLEETLQTFQALIDEGQVRYVGASNYSARRLLDALRLGEREGLARYIALQPHYNLMERAYELDLAGVCEHYGLACIPYFGLARGFLTGKYRPDGKQVDSPRASGVRANYFNERGFATLEALDEIAAAHHTSMAAVALTWLLAQPNVIAPIASATSIQQLTELLPLAEIELSAAEVERLGAASA